MRHCYALIRTWIVSSKAFFAVISRLFSACEIRRKKGVLKMQRPIHGGVLRSISSSLFNKTRSLFAHPKRNRHARRRYRKLYGDHQVQPLEPRVLLSATLGGDAWYDLNNNAINDAGDVAVGAGIVVNLLDSGGTQLDTTVTNASGQYSFADIAAGDYRIEFVSPSSNFVFVTQDAGSDTLDSDADVTTGRTAVITLADSDVLDDVDAGFSALSVYVDDDWSGVADGDDPDGVGAATIFGVDAFANIQDAIDHLTTGGTIYVADGTYDENLFINKDLTLLSENGRDTTFINGISGVGALGAIRVTNTTTAVQIGDIDQGFSILGVDNGNAVVENAAIYLQGAHSGLSIIGNEIIADGDHGLLSEYGHAITNALIDHNIFSGKTFTGANPAGEGFGAQFSLANVPRQLVSISGGASSSNDNITFSNNQITGPP